MRRALLIPSIALALTGMSASVQAADEAPATEAAGLKVARDPSTGHLRAPTEDEARELHEKGNRQGAQARAQSNAQKLHMRVHAGNARNVRMTDEFVNHTVVTRGANGELQMQCLPSKSAAESAVSMSARTVASRLPIEE
jgi:hypothetical protein